VTNFYQGMQRMIAKSLGESQGFFLANGRKKIFSIF